jgi:hypothetical protein
MSAAIGVRLPAREHLHRYVGKREFCWNRRRDDVAYRTARLPDRSAWPAPLPGVNHMTTIDLSHASRSSDRLLTFFSSRGGAAGHARRTRRLGRWRASAH